MEKIVIAGGTGFIGSYIHNRFKEMGYSVIIISRKPNNISWDQNDLINAFEGAEMIINLAGYPINCQHSEAVKVKILNSRTNSTFLIGKAIQACENPPKIWINTSATGIYKSSLTQPMNEDELDFGSDFLAKVVTQWEKVFFDFQFPDTRQIALRTSVVLGEIGGALHPLVQLTRIGLGGKQGTGMQMFSWIHLEDYFRILIFLLKTSTAEGVFNCTSPFPVTNKMFMKELQRKLHVLYGIPAPKFLIEFASKFICIEPGLILNSSYVIPKKILEMGFQFKFPLIDGALSDLLE